MALSLNQLVPAVVAIAVAAIAIGMIAKTLTEIRDTETSTVSGLYNATTEGVDTMQTMAEFLPTLGIVVIAAIVIGVLIMYFR
jgi:flagellar motor component MotA